jgi:hypothetical protein
LSENNLALLWRKKGDGVYTLIFPNRFAIDEATSIEAAAIILVVKKREPSIPSLRSNFRLKNQITQELVTVRN